MNTLLSEIVSQKREEILELKTKGIGSRGVSEIFPPRDFKKAVSMPRGINLIAEIKFASPSAGVIREYTDPVGIGRMYEQAGAAAISVVTDRRFFRGDLDLIPRLKAAVSLPLLRKDFILDEVQVRESVLHGADAVLLIARLLSAPELEGLVELCRRYGLCPLVEIHDRDDLERAVHCGADVIGINNRNLEDFTVDLSTTSDLARRLPEGTIVVSESGIQNGEDVRRLSEDRVHAVLVGSTLMKSKDIPEKVRELVRGGERWSG